MLLTQVYQLIKIGLFAQDYTW